VRDRDRLRRTYEETTEIDRKREHVKDDIISGKRMIRKGTIERTVIPRRRRHSTCSSRETICIPI